MQREEVIDFALKLKQDEGYTSLSESSNLIANEVMQTGSGTFTNCRALCHFIVLWNKFCSSRHQQLQAELQTCSVSDLQVVETLGQGSAGQLFRVLPPSATDDSTSTEHKSERTSVHAAIALKKIYDLNADAAVTDFEEAQRKDYTVPFRYPHEYV